MLAKRVTATVLYDNKDISADLAVSLQGLSYTDNMSGEADTLDLQLEDIAGMWQDSWFQEARIFSLPSLRMQPILPISVQTPPDISPVNLFS